MDAFEGAEVVFAGYAVEQCVRLERELPSGDRPVEAWTFDLVAIWKGHVGAPIRSPYGAGMFQLGRLYLVYADADDGDLTRSRRSREWSRALVDLYQLPSPSEVSPRFELTTITLDSMIQSVIDGSPENNWLVHEFKWLQQDSERIVPEFTSVLRSQAPGDIEVAVKILGYMGPASHAAVPDLEAIARDGSERLRKQAFLALDRIETNDKERLRRFNESLSDPSPQVRIAAIARLSRILAWNDPFAEWDPVIRRIKVVSASDPHAHVRQMAARLVESWDEKH